MTEKVEKKTGKDMSKSEFFDSEIKKVKQNQVSAIIKGWAIIFLVLIVAYIGSRNIFISMVTVPFTFFLMMYFVWGPEDVCWASFPREGYTKGVLLGNHIRRFVGVPNGKAYDDDWNVVDADHPSVAEKTDYDLLGMHIIYEWPFGKIYQEKTEWERWYPNLRKAMPKRELLREFTLLPYPYYLDVVDAEDLNRLGVTIYMNVVMHIVNPKKALFKQATTWIDIVKPLLQGGCVSYVKGTTLQEMLGKGVKDLGADLLLNMPSSDPNKLLKDKIEEVYGIRIESISVLDVVGSDEDEQKAIKAKAIAKLNREAALIDANTKAQSEAIDSIGKIIKMLAQMVSETKPSGKDQDQQAAWDETENILKTMLRDDPKRFEELYGNKFNVCVDILHRQMALEKGKFTDIRTPDNKGGSNDALTVLLAANLIGSGGAGSKSGGEKEKKKGKIFSEEAREALKKVGIPTEIEDDL